MARQLFVIVAGAALAARADAALGTGRAAGEPWVLEADGTALKDARADAAPSMYEIEQALMDMVPDSLLTLSADEPTAEERGEWDAELRHMLRQTGDRRRAQWDDEVTERLGLASSD